MKKYSSRNVTGPPSLGGGERSEQGVVLPLPVENEPSHPCVTDFVIVGLRIADWGLRIADCGKVLPLVRQRVYRGGCAQAGLKSSSLWPLGSYHGWSQLRYSGVSLTAARPDKHILEISWFVIRDSWFVKVLPLVRQRVYRGLYTGGFERPNSSFLENRNYPASGSGGSSRTE